MLIFENCKQKFPEMIISADADFKIAVFFNFVGRKQKVGQLLYVVQGTSLYFARNNSFILSIFQAWLQNIEWLTVSLSKKSMFCFYCILFNGDSTWSIIGYDKLKNFLEKQKLHEATNSHIRCALKFKLFRKVNTLCQLNRAYAHTIKAHNDNVEKNRKILGKIIDTLKFCGKLDATTIRTDHDETESPDTKGLFLDMLEHAARLDTPLKAFLETATVDRNTLKSIRKDLLDSIFIVYTNAIKEHIRETNFVAIVADDTTDVSCSLQFVIVIRYVYNMKPVERFLKFVHVVERKAEELTKVLTEALSEFNIKRKLVAQSYDGAAIMSANKKSVSTLMQQHFPMAQHVFCYKHTSDLLLKKVCSSVSHARIFFANLSAFSTFFSSSCRRSDVWQEICQTVETKSNFQSRVGVVHWIFELKHTLISLFDEIIHNDSVDDTTITEAIGLVNLLNNREFLFFLNLFNDILFHVDILIGTCQETATINIEAKNDAVNSFVNAIHDIKQRIYQYEVEPEENATTNKVNLASVGEEACDVIVNNLVDRFETAVHIDLFSVIDPKRFADYKKQFPIDNYQKIIEFYDLQQEKLRNELNVLYSSDMSR